jgi:hypothetical protein
VAEGDLLAIPEAIGRLAVRQRDDGKQVVHTFVQAANGMILGADWTMKEVGEALRTHVIKEAGPQAQSMNHGIVLQGIGGEVWLATRP